LVVGWSGGRRRDAEAVRDGMFFQSPKVAFF